MSRMEAVVPTFGNWDLNDNVPYTMVFEKARERKGGKIFNPNDPAEYAKLHDMAHCTGEGRNIANPNDPAEYPTFFPNRHLDGKGPTFIAQQRTGHMLDTVQDTQMGHLRYEERVGKENKVFRRREFGSSAASYVTSLVKGPTEDKTTYQSLRHDGKSAGKPEASYFAPDQNSVDDSSGSNFPHTGAGRPRALSVSSRGSDAASERSSVPKFGDWDISDPSSAEGFTVIFDKARNERKSKAVQISSLQSMAAGSADEDLYKPNPSQKSFIGLRNLMCCGYSGST